MVAILSSYRRMSTRAVMGVEKKRREIRRARKQFSQFLKSAP
jgi:hypothetical protein